VRYRGYKAQRLLNRRAAVIRRASMLKVCYRTPDMSME
jgi:hypothetical protein